MNNIVTKEVKHYIKDIRGLMPVYSKVEKQYLSFLQERIFDYINENPFCTMENIYKQFGDPKDIMEQYLFSLEHEYIQDKLRVKRKVAIVSTACIVVILIIGIVFSVKYYQDHLLAREADIGQEEIIIEEF
ncbi:hypothetical protein M2140_000189 [Clostridiales Family XIII bacterium PM5-7]